jgi:hypothetical protein
MKNLLKVEELAILLLAIFLFSELSYEWWVFPALLLAPDIGMLGYLVSTRVGAFTYNLFHHKGVAILLYLCGAYWEIDPLMLSGAIMLGHSGMDRVFNYGLKYPDAFKHTHLGWIGGAIEEATEEAITEAG